MLYVVEGLLGSVVARVRSVDEAVSTVLSQMTMSDKALAKFRTRLERTVLGRCSVDFGGVGCTVHVIDESTDE
jgi:hypothetical protein